MLSEGISTLMSVPVHDNRRQMTIKLMWLEELIRLVALTDYQLHTGNRSEKLPIGLDSFSQCSYRSVFK